MACYNILGGYFAAFLIS